MVVLCSQVIFRSIIVLIFSFCFEKQGATIVGAWSTDGYEHEESKSVRGDNLLGCAFDEDNQPDDSEDRAKKWVEQIKGEGEESRLSGFAASSDATILQKPLFSQRRPTIDIEVVSEVFFPKCDDFHMP